MLLTLNQRPKISMTDSVQISRLMMDRVKAVLL